MSKHDSTLTADGVEISTCTDLWYRGQDHGAEWEKIPYNTWAIIPPPTPRPDSELWGSWRVVWDIQSKISEIAFVRDVYSKKGGDDE